MNPFCTPLSSTQSHFNPSNPSLNANIFPFHPQSSVPPPPPPQPGQQLQTSVPDLSNTYSLLSNLLQLSTSTLQALPTLLPSTGSTSLQSVSRSNSQLVRCSSNPHHLMPPESLFLHYLNCPTKLDVRFLVDSLQYPKTLKTEEQLIQQNKFVQPLNDPRNELCFSIDDYVDFDSNFFYLDCPGVVSSSNDDTNNRIFSLPGVLSIECMNFVGSCQQEGNGFGKSFVKLLPSEVWVLRREVARWSDYPEAYSYCVLRALLYLEKVKDSDVLFWLIANSPRFGIVIDLPMRDHMFVLLRICFKAIIREAYQSFESLIHGHMDGDGGKLNPESFDFRCPVLVDVLGWLTSQLRILYGETNAKSFAIEIIKNVLLKVAANIPFMEPVAETFPQEKDSLGSDLNGSTWCSPPKIMENEGDSGSGQWIIKKPVFVYQVAAAIAALHERSLLEEKIKAIRSPRMLTPYQRVIEYSGFSEKAEQERQKDPKYRPILEHDGLPSMHPLSRGGNNRSKTREELLAEERDYKRRRMSYRGKKSNRNAKEVIRDIIEDYTEAISLAGGIGCPTKGVEESGAASSEPLHDKNNVFYGGFKSRDILHDHTMDLTFDNSDRQGQKAQVSFDHDDQHEYRGRTSGSVSKRYYHSRSPKRGRSPYRNSDRSKQDSGVSEAAKNKYSHSRSSTRSRSPHRSRKRSHRREEDHGVEEVTEEKHHRSNRRSSSISKYHDRRSSSRTSSVNISYGSSVGPKVRASSRRRRTEEDISEDERYVPSESHDVYNVEAKAKKRHRD